ncbi:MAG: hypothetical protein AAF611_04000 [Bacteroidota bacterium]
MKKKSFKKVALQKKRIATLVKSQAITGGNNGSKVCATLVDANGNNLCFNTEFCQTIRIGC